MIKNMFKADVTKNKVTHCTLDTKFYNPTDNHNHTYFDTEQKAQEYLIEYYSKRIEEKETEIKKFQGYIEKWK